jgi:thiol-disulfide isomerase/thioredoxin
VLVNFWATWCPPCRAEIPDLIALYKGNTARLAVIGIAMDYDDPKQVISFAHDMHINYPIVLGNEAIANQIGQIEGLPTTYLYNPEGKIVATQVGALTRSVVEDYMNAHTNSHGKKK